MRKIILQIDITLDGFIAGPNGETDWVTEDQEMNEDANDLLSTVDTILLGRVIYQMFVDYWPSVDTSGSTIESKIAQNLNAATKIVLSNTLDHAEWGQWNNARVMKGDIAEEMSKIKSQPGRNLILYGGSDTVSTFMRLNLIDDYRLRIHPVVVGGGKPLFKDITQPVGLKLLRTKTYKNNAVILHYESEKK